MDSDTLLNSKDDIKNQLISILNDVTNTYGVKINDIQILNIQKKQNDNIIDNTKKDFNNDDDNSPIKLY